MGSRGRVVARSMQHGVVIWLYTSDTGKFRQVTLVFRSQQPNRQSQKNQIGNLQKTNQSFSIFILIPFLLVKDKTLVPTINILVNVNLALAAWMEGVTVTQKVDID